MMSIVRAFAAIELTPETKNFIYTIASSLDLPNFKKVEKENIHLTIKFYGNIQLKKLKIIAEETGKSLKGFKAFRFEIGEPGFFPSVYRARVFWFGIKEGVEELKKIYNIIESVSVRLGVEPELREFTPHITAGRFRKPFNMKSKLSSLKNLEKDKYKVEVDSLVFFESKLTPSGPIYTKLFTVNFPEGGVSYHR